MRRPVTLSGMIVHLARIQLARVPVSMRVGAVGLAAVGALAMGVSKPSPEVSAPRAHHLVAPLAGGRCVATRSFCVADVMCGRGDRCVDSRDLRGLVARARTPETLDDTLPITPSLIWNGDGYALVWSSVDEETADLWFARADAAGRRVGQPVRLTRTPSLKLFPSLAASPEGYALAWTDIDDDGLSAWMLRLDKTGAARGAPLKITPPNGLDIAPRVAWSGSEYAVAWYRASSSSELAIRFARFAPDGSRVGEERAVTEGITPTGLFDMRSMGDGFGLAWSVMNPRSGAGQTLFARVSPDGSASTPLRVTAGDAQNGNTSLTWTGRHFGLVWEDAVSLDDDAPLSRLAFAGVSPTAVVVASKHLTPRDAYFTQATIAWSGAQYGLAYARIGGDGADVYFNRVDAQGGASRSPLHFTRGAIGLFPSLAWSGREFAVAWTHVGARGIQLRLARVNADGRKVGDDVVIAGE